MKRRNVESNKNRKQYHHIYRKCKFTEGMYGRIFLYLKFLLIWALIMIADYLIEFRFEFLWPFWLLIRSIYDSFKYQGLIFSMFFAIIAFLSDLFCYMFIPVQWLFFASSTYVWVQYVWHTEKGICLPTISLWLFFVYIEALFRVKNTKTIDLCRPFAAHCIGYPIVTLGFGLKSYLSYKLRLRKQKEIRKINDFYIDLLMMALPIEMREQQQQQQQKEHDSETQHHQIHTEQYDDEIIETNNKQQYSNDSKNSSTQSLIQNFKEKYLFSLPTISNSNNNSSNNNGSSSSNSTSSQTNKVSQASKSNNSNSVSIYKEREKNHNNQTNEDEYSFYYQQKEHQAKFKNSFSTQDLQLTNNKSKDNFNNNNKKNSSSNSHSSSSSTTSESSSHSNSFSSTKICPSISTNHTNININMTINATAIAAAAASNTNTVSSANNNTKKASSSSKNKQQQQQAQSTSSSNQSDIVLANTLNASTMSSQLLIKDELIKRLENDLKRMQQDLAQQKAIETYLKKEINYLTEMERDDKLKFDKLQADNQLLQIRFNKISMQKQKEKEEINQLEKKLVDEKRTRTSIESQLALERKNNKENQEKSLLNSTTNTKLNNRNSENIDIYLQKIKDLELENKSLQDQLNQTNERLTYMENDTLLKQDEYTNHYSSLAQTILILEQKNTSLQESLSSETRFKLNLISALGDARRQQEQLLATLKHKEEEIYRLQSSLNAIIGDQSSFDLKLQQQYLAGPSYLTSTSPSSSNGSTSPQQSVTPSLNQNQFQSTFNIDLNSSNYKPKI